MSNPARASDRASVYLSTTFQDWQPSQTWLAERTRTVTSRLFAQANLEDTEGGDIGTVAVHKGAITAQVSKIFGALFDENAPRFSVSWIVDVLVHLADLGDIGHGYYIPRESRVVRLTENWGRIAGGLPLELSEHPEGGIRVVPCESIGRLVEMEQAFSAHNRSTEYSEVFEWTTRSVDLSFADLCERLPARAATAPPDIATVYYNAQYQRARTRGDRWQAKLPIGIFVVARTGTLPTHYSVHVHKEGQRNAAWFEVTHGEVRKWILLAERIAGSKNRIPMSVEGNCVSLFLPNMLPQAWTGAILACASAVIPAENGWRLEIQSGAMELLERLLRSANIQLL